MAPQPNRIAPDVSRISSALAVSLLWPDRTPHRGLDIFSGSSRRFAETQQFGRFRSEVEVGEGVMRLTWSKMTRTGRELLPAGFKVLCCRSATLRGNTLCFGDPSRCGDRFRLLECLRPCRMFSGPAHASIFSTAGSWLFLNCRCSVRCGSGLADECTSSKGGACGGACCKPCCS